MKVNPNITVYSLPIPVVVGHPLNKGVDFNTVFKQLTNDELEYDHLGTCKFDRDSNIYHIMYRPAHVLNNGLVMYPMFYYPIMLVHDCRCEKPELIDNVEALDDSLIERMEDLLNRVKVNEPESVEPELLDILLDLFGDSFTLKGKEFRITDKGLLELVDKTQETSSLYRDQRKQHMLEKYDVI